MKIQFNEFQLLLQVCIFKLNHKVYYNRIPLYYFKMVPFIVLAYFQQIYFHFQTIAISWNSIILAVFHKVGMWPNLRTEFNKVKRQCALSEGVDCKAFELTLSRLGALLGVREIWVTGSEYSTSGVQHLYNSRQRGAVTTPNLLEASKLALSLSIAVQQYTLPPTP